MAKLEKQTDTPETKAFWEAAEEAAREVATWPAWKRLEDHRRPRTGTSEPPHPSPTDTSPRHRGDS